MKTIKNPYLTLIFLTILLRPLLIESCNAIDEEALLDFKQRIEYETRGNLATWVAKTDCCATWYGVKCDAANGRVVNLSPFRSRTFAQKFDSVNLNGTLSPFLGNLTYLRVLDLYLFQQYYDLEPSGFRGPIPPQLGHLSQLTTISLVSNLFTGSIPISFCWRNTFKFWQFQGPPLFEFVKQSTQWPVPSSTLSGKYTKPGFIEKSTNRKVAFFDREHEILTVP
ncbi:hypothetical protein SOVF_111620 [Spinacia oleracea]|nr:hypothetical protein SOVF_111620 [Spinacia oleracea]